MSSIFKVIICLSLLLQVTGCANNSKNTKMITTTNNGFVLKRSALDFETTFSKLKNAIDTNPKLTIMLIVDHSENAAAKGLTLRPTRTLFFGNPLLGTPLMKNQAAIAIDLPQKIVIYELENGSVELGYNDPFYLKERHGLVGQDEVLSKVSNALDKITNMAISN